MKLSATVANPIPGWHGLATTRHPRVVALLGSALAALLAGCCPDPLIRTRTVEVPVYVPVAVAADLTTQEAIAQPRNPTCGEAVRVARERRAGLERCNARLGTVERTHGQDAQADASATRAADPASD